MFIKIKEKFLVCSFEVNKKENGFVAELENYEIDGKIKLKAKTKKKIKKKIKKWIKEIAKDKSYKKLKEKEYAIEINAKSLLKQFKNSDFAYHVAKKENRERIKEHGLVPNGTKDNDTYRPNVILDELKPDYIDSEFKKSESVYLYTNILNDMLFDVSYLKNCVLYGVDMSNLEGYVGSIGLSGFVLFDEEMGEVFNQKQEERIRNEYAKMYWENTLSTKEYKTNKKKRKKIEKEYGLDEILICSKIPNEKIIEIGHWDECGRFHFNNFFDCFVSNQSKLKKEEVQSLY